MDKRMTFEEAVQYVRRIKERGERRRNLVGSIRVFSAATYLQCPVNYRSWYLAWLIESSAEDPHSWDIVSLIAQQLQRNREPIPKDLKDWVADATKPKSERKCSRPTKKGPDPWKYTVRNTLILCSVKTLTDCHGFSAKRTSEALIRTDLLEDDERWKGCVEGDSACDVVSVVFDLRYSRIKQLWDNSAKPNALPRRTDVIPAPDGILLGD